MKDKNKKSKTMAEVSSGYENFIKGKKLNKVGKAAFEMVIKKAVKPRSVK